MNWVAPIKDEETLTRFMEALRAVDDKYYILFEIGVGTGLQLQDILKFRNRDIRGKQRLEVRIGTKKTERVFEIPEKLQQIILEYTEGKDPDACLIQGHGDPYVPLSREQAYRVINAAGKSIGLTSIGAQSMRKTFAWRYYKETGDIGYLQKLFNHASPSITYRYIGEKPGIQKLMKKLTPEENERSRCLLYKDDNGKKRIGEIREVLDSLERGLDDPTRDDAFYGAADCLLTEFENLVTEFRAIK